MLVEPPEVRSRRGSSPSRLDGADRLAIECRRLLRPWKVAIPPLSLVSGWHPRARHIEAPPSQPGPIEVDARCANSLCSRGSELSPTVIARRGGRLGSGWIAAGGWGRVGGPSPLVGPGGTPFPNRRPYFSRLRKPPVLQDLAARLLLRAVVHLMLGEEDRLDRRPAARAGLALVLVDPQRLRQLCRAAARRRRSSPRSGRSRRPARAGPRAGARPPRRSRSEPFLNGERRASQRISSTQERPIPAMVSQTPDRRAGTVHRRADTRRASA